MELTKTALRQQLRGSRRSRTAEQAAQTAQALLRVAKDAGMVTGCVDCCGRPDGRSASDSATRAFPAPLAAFISSPQEPDLSVLLRARRECESPVLLPIPGPGRELAWAWDTGMYSRDRRLPVDIPTSDVVDATLAELGVTLILVPALAVDESGSRLGQGGGFYDTLLAKLPPGRIATLAVVFPHEVLPPGLIPVQAHDQRVDGAFTPDGISWFRT